jgi:hypothetical protein
VGAVLGRRQHEPGEGQQPRVEVELPCAVLPERVLDPVRRRLDRRQFRRTGSLAKETGPNRSSSAVRASGRLPGRLERTATTSCSGTKACAVPMSIVPATSISYNLSYDGRKRGVPQAARGRP